MTITQLALTYYALLPDFYWRYLYKHKVKSGAKISLQSFKDLYSLHRAIVLVEQVKEWHRRLVYAPLHVMNPLSDLLQSRLLEDLRLAHARYFNLFLFRQSLDYHSNTPKGNSTKFHNSTPGVSVWQNGTPLVYKVPSFVTSVDHPCRLSSDQFH